MSGPGQRRRRFLTGLSLTLITCLGALRASAVERTTADVTQYATNDAAVYRLSITARTNVVDNPQVESLRKRLAATNTFSPAIVERLRKRLETEPEFNTNLTYLTNRTFDHVAPESLNYAVLTNFHARTNDKNAVLWSTRRHPLTWPLSAPVVRWNTNCVIYGFKGLTALSPCWQGEGATGQVPITLLTRRHGYARGHGMGLQGLRDTFNGKRVWFVTADDRMVEARIAGAIVRYSTGSDYTILMFERDLPPDIQPLTAMSRDQMNAYYPWATGLRPLLLQTEQEGRVNAELPGFTVPAFKGGDSGSPDLVPIGNELIFVGGRATSPPSSAMQADIDELCRQEGVDPKPYQIRWVDLAQWPKYR